MNEKLIDKIRKLLRLSDSPNENEAKLAMEKALEIAQLHGIEISKITTEVKTNSINDESIQMGQRLPIVGNYVFCILSKSLSGNYSDSFYDGVEKGKETNLHAGFIA